MTNGVLAAPAAVDGDRRTLGLGAGCAIAGTLGYLILVVLHGDLPAEHPGHTLAHVAGWSWPVIHLGSILCMALLLVAVTALRHALPRADSGTRLVRLGQPLLTVALAVFGVEFAIDGFALPMLAERFDASAIVDQAGIIAQTQTVLTVMGGISMLTQTLFGLAFTAIAAGTARANGFPSWLGWIGAAGGLGWFAVGAAMFTGVPGANFGLAVVFVNLVWVWMFGVGVVLRRWSRRRA